MQLNTRKGRGVPLSDGEKRRIDELQERGCNQKEIAEMLARNRKTVGKYMNLRGRHLEARVREQVLAQALQEHFRELNSLVKVLKERFNPCTAWNVSTLDMPMPTAHLPAEPLLALPIPGEPTFVFNTWYRMYGDLDTKSNYLIQSLKEVHARESPLWDLWRQWDRITDYYAHAGRVLWSWLNTEINNEVPKHQGVIVKEQLAKVLMGHALLIADKEFSIAPAELEIHLIKKNARPELTHMGTVIAIGKEAAALEAACIALLQIHAESELQQSWLKLQEGLSKIRESQPRLRKLHGEIENELDILSLRKAFPGRCQLCPF